jgi:hypothetical protein
MINDPEETDGGGDSGMTTPSPPNEGSWSFSTNIHIHDRAASDFTIRGLFAVGGSRLALMVLVCGFFALVMLVISVSPPWIGRITVVPSVAAFALIGTANAGSILLGILLMRVDVESNLAWSWLFRLLQGIDGLSAKLRSEHRSGHNTAD